MAYIYGLYIFNNLPSNSRAIPSSWNKQQNTNRTSIFPVLGSWRTIKHLLYTCVEVHRAANVQSYRAFDINWTGNPFKNLATCAVEAQLRINKLIAITAQFCSKLWKPCCFCNYPSTPHKLSVINATVMFFQDNYLQNKYIELYNHTRLRFTYFS